MPRRTEEEPRQDDDTLLDRYLWLTRGAVERCVTHGDLKVGLLLSGGVDSTLLALLVGELGLTERVTAFSFGDAASPDLPWARWVAKHVGLRLVELPPRVDGLLDTLDDVAGAMVGYPAINIFALFQALRTAAPDLKVVMCGEGSDELFGGYPRIGRLPQHLAELQHAAERVGCTSSLLTRLQKTVGVLEGGPALLDWWMAVERSEQLVDAHLIPFDFGAMAFGCEVRVPFLDPRIWSLTCSLRTNTIVRPTEMKWLPKAMVRRLETGVPSELLSRRKVALPQAFAPGLVALRRDAFMRPRDVFDTAVGLPPFLHRWYAATARALNDVGTAA